MSRRRFFVPRDQIRDGRALLPADQAHHLRDVLRIRSGAEVELFDGEGSCYTGKVEIHRAEIRIVALRKTEPAENPWTRLILAPALIKSERFEWILQKATELGVREFIPLKTRFSDIRISDSKLEARLQRWQRVVREA